MHTVLLLNIQTISIEAPNLECFVKDWVCELIGMANSEEIEYVHVLFTFARSDMAMNNTNWFESFSVLGREILNALWSYSVLGLTFLVLFPILGTGNSKIGTNNIR